MEIRQQRQRSDNASAVGNRYLSRYGTGGKLQLKSAIMYGTDVYEISDDMDNGISAITQATRIGLL